MLEERRVRELLDHPLNHHHLLQLQQLQQQAQQQQQQHQSHHHHRGSGGGGDRGDRDRGDHHRERDRGGDRDHHHHHRERERDVRERERERQYHHHSQQLQQQQQQHHHRERERERERERSDHRGDRIERDRDRAERIERDHHHRGERLERLERERERAERHQDQYQQQQQQHHHHSQAHQSHHHQHQNSVNHQQHQQQQQQQQQLLTGLGHDDRKHFDCTSGALPKGWVREEIVRKTGLSAGKIDVCYHSPNGKKFWSKPQLSRFLGDSVDLSTFDFRTGKVNNLLLRKNKKHRPHPDYSRGFRSDTTLLPPIRQTASIFKQPVTVHKTQKLSTVKQDFKHGHQEKPKQLFWEKRLEGYRSCDRGGVPLDNLDLPRGVEPVGPNINPDTVLQSVATALHVNGQPITGQTMPRNNLDNNPGVYINPEQPLIQAVNVREDDINRQEEKVLAARKRLEDALKAYDLF